MTKEDYISRKAPKWYVVLLRLYMGYYYIQSAVIRIRSGDWRGEELARHYRQLKSGLSGVPWFDTYLEYVIDKIQGNELFGLLLTAAPLLLGASLVVGLWCRLSTFLGILYVVHLYLINVNAALGTLMFYQLQIAVLAVLFLSASGRTLGIDGLFWRNRIALRFEPVPPRNAGGRVRRVPAGPPSTRPETPVQPTGTIPLYGEEEEAPEARGAPPATEAPEADEPSIEKVEEEEKPPESDKPDFGT